MEKRCKAVGKRSQIVIEYMLLAAMGFALLLIFTAAFQDRFQDISSRQEQDQLDALAVAVERELVLAAKVEPGYERTFTIPYVIGTKDLVVEGTPKQVILRTERFERTFIIPESRGSLSLGENLIRNIDGVVCIGAHCDDTVMPAITLTSPNGTVAGPSVMISVDTDEDATCRYDVKDTLFANMGASLDGTGTAHTRTVTLSPGTYTYYTRCRDAAGNAMDASEVISFLVT